MISLIVATINRVAEFEYLLASLDGQSYRDFEVIVVDQNPDDRLVSIISKHDRLTIHHLRSGRGISRARNVGLPLAKGDIICFPDDDCWYPEQLLANVANWFASHPDRGGFLAILRNANNTPVGPKWPPGARLCTREDMWRCAISPNVFLRREVTDAVGFFNENIGVGAASRYQSGEDADYLLRGFDLGLSIWYEPAITVHHPDFHSKERLRERTYPYALSCGYLLRLRGYSVLELSRWLVRSFGGAFVSLCKGDIFLTYTYLVRAGGQLRGYFLGPGDMRRTSKSAPH
jgi:glycosyltransferase involved in cell wall biosynthesis